LSYTTNVISNTPTQIAVLDLKKKLYCSDFW